MIFKVIIFCIGFILIYWSQPIIERQVLGIQENLEMPKMSSDISEYEYFSWRLYFDLGGGKMQILYLLYRLIFYPEGADNLILASNYAIEIFVITIFKLLNHQN